MVWRFYQAAALALVFIVPFLVIEATAASAGVAAGVAAGTFALFLVARRAVSVRRPDPLAARSASIDGRDDDRIDVLHRVGWRLLEQRRYERAAAIYRQAAELGDVDAMVNLGNLLCDELDSRSEATMWYEHAIERGSAPAAEHLALLRLDEGRIDDARELFERARQGGHTPAYLGLAQVESDRGDLARARALSRSRSLEGQLDAYAPLGEVLWSMDRVADAERHLREGVDRGACGAATVLAALLEACDRTDEVVELQDAIDRDRADVWPPR